MAYTKLIPRQTPGARVEQITVDHAYRLMIPAGPAGKYRLAQLDDYAQLRRGQFPLRFPLSLRLSARASSESIPGTWGFGLWNDPFGLSLGFGGNPFRLPALPNAAWFFSASKESYLSFRDPPRPERIGARWLSKSSFLLDRIETSAIQTEGNDATGGLDTRETSTRSTRPPAANGFLAQTFRSPKFHPFLILAGLALPFSRKTTRRLTGTVIGEDGIDMSTGDQPVIPTQWHRYGLEWRAERVLFKVDDVQVFESHVSPHPPLGLVIWIDNQYAAFTPEGRIGFGVLENPEPAWLEIKDLELEQNRPETGEIHPQ